MPLARRSLDPERTDVLHLDGRRAEWFRAHVAEGECGYAAVEAGGATAADLAAAAREARAAVGGQKRRCVLVLDGTHVRLKQQKIPPLAPKELATVLRRKAAALWDRPEAEVAFFARHLGSEADAAPESAAQVWMIAALLRADALALRLALRRVGIEVVAVRPARWSPVVAAHVGLPVAEEGADGAASTRRAAIVVSAEPEATTLTLFDAQAVHSVDVLEGSLRDGSSHAVSLLQELRGLDAYWRKESRGGSVDRILIAGLDDGRAATLSAAVRSTLPQARVERLSALGGEDSGRREAMMTALAESPFVLDLTLPLPSRRRVTALLLTMICGVSIALAAITWRGMNTDLERLATKVERMRSESTGLAELEAERTSVERAEARLSEALETYARVRSDGFDPAFVVAELWSACADRVVPETVSITRNGEEFVLDLRARADAHPVRGAVAVEGLQRDLEASASFADVVVAPPTQLPEASGERNAAFEVALRARLEVGR